MSLTEINFDGIVGPSHNYAGLSLGNLAATANAGAISHPRQAALQGLEKMRANMALGLAQGFFVPLPRPSTPFLAAIAADSDPGSCSGAGSCSDSRLGGADPRLIAAAWSASSMWTANAATVSPAPDTPDGRCHLTPANLVTMPHRSIEWPDTARQLALAFADKRHFALHDPIPPCFGDEGAANHMRLAPDHGQGGLEIFVYGRSGGAFPARQHEQASRAVARLHGLASDRVLFLEQNPVAIAAGAFHNDVVAVANGTVLFAHEQAFADQGAAQAAILEKFPQAQFVTVASADLSLEEAVKSYLFNGQLVSLPDGETALIIPLEAWENSAVRNWLDRMLESRGPIGKILPVDVRQSMSNGGGPACLRLRVVADPSTIDPRFLMDERKADQIGQIIAATWPEQIDPADLGQETLKDTVVAARLALLGILGLEELA